MKKALLFLTLSSLFLLSCSGGKSSSASEVDNICSCIKKTEYFDIIKEIDFNKMEDQEYAMKIAGKMMKVDYDSKESLETFKCIAKNLKSILNKYNDLKDDKQKGQLVRSTMTALINNECVATIVDKLPYDKIDEAIEKNELDLSIKDMIKILDKIENAKEFDDIQKEVTKLILSNMGKSRMRYEEPKMEDLPVEEVPMEEESTEE